MSSVLDLICTIFLLAVAAVVGVAHWVKRRTGRARSFDRVEAAGATALLGLDTMNATYWMMELPLAIAQALRLTPNGVTFGSLVLALGAGVAFGLGHFGVGALLSTFSTLADILDGQLARRLGVSSERGELFDAAVDRIGEFAFFGGVAVAYRHNVGWLILALAALQGAYMVSYASAKLETVPVKAPRGVMRRAERAVYLLVGAAFVPIVSAVGERRGWAAEVGHWPLLGALALIAVLANASAVYRFFAVWRAMGEAPVSQPRASAPGDALASPGVGPG